MLQTCRHDREDILGLVGEAGVVFLSSVCETRDVVSVHADATVQCRTASCILPSILGSARVIDGDGDMQQTRRNQSMLLHRA